MEQKIRFVFINEGESELPAFGAFRQFSMKDGAPYIRFNMDAFCSFTKEEKEDKVGDLKESLLQVLTHECCHAFQEYLDMELDEATVDKIIEAYNPSWVTRDEASASEQPEPMVSAEDTIRFLKHLLTLQNPQEIRKEINDLLPSLESWAYKG